MDDLLNFDELLTEEERFIRDNLARFIKDRALPLLPDAFEKGTFPSELIPAFAEMGLFGLTLPSSYGGSEASYLTYGLVCQELERGDSGLRSFISVQNSLCMEPIFRFGTEAQKKTYLPDMVKGKLIACFGLTEPDSGSDPSSMKTFAKKVAGGYEITGSKMWITNASIADLAIVWAKTDEGIRGFLIPKTSKGFKRVEIHHKMSLRASLTGELVFDQVFVPDDQLLPGTQAGLKTALHCLNQARFGIAWGAIGAAMACFDITQDYLLTRSQGSKPLASMQMIQESLAEMYSQLIQAQCYNHRLTQLKQAGRETPVMLSLGKRNACRVALFVARTCRNLLGANGISLEYHVIRHMLNLESVFTYEGTDNVHTLVIGRHITGINAFHAII
jgi:glutaryl-CoA dehydrogenase